MKSAAFLVVLALSPGAAAAPPAWTVSVTGMVANPATLDRAALAGLKQASLAGSFDSMSGRQTHRWTGPALLDVIGQATMTDEPGTRTHMRHVFLARGSDGYAASLALGEIDPKGEGKQVIVALTQDGTRLTAPRLVVPGDASFTRAVHDLVEIQVK